MKFCMKSLLFQPYYLHQDVTKLACSDNRVNIIYGLFVGLTAMLELECISVLLAGSENCSGHHSHDSHLKVLNTCIFHICAVLIFYVPIITLAIMHRFAMNKSPLAMILIADTFLLVPPLMNPIVYCVKTQQIRGKILKKLGLKSK